jgi:type I restriction enzyme, S subunit
MSTELRQRWEHAGGQLPADWTIVPLESLLRDSKSIAVGVMYPGPDTPGGTPLLKVGDIKGGMAIRPAYCISTEVDEEHKRTRLVGDELMITLVGNPGECVIVTPEMRGWNPARAIAVMKLNDTSFRTYLKAVLESTAGRHLIDAVLNTTVQKTLNLKDIRKLPIPLPSKAEILWISSISESLTNRITLLRETNATLEGIAQALFKSWFVDFDPVRAKMQGRTPEGMDEATAALFPDSLEESELGLVPKGWRTSRIDEFMELAYGKALKSTDRIPGEFPVYGSGGVTGCHNESLVIGPSIIIGRKGTVGSLFWEDRPFFAIDTVFYVRTKVAMTYCFYLLQLMKLTEMNTDAAVPGLNRGNVYRLKLPFPSEAILSAFDGVMGVIRQQIYCNNQTAQTLITLRDTLLPRLISGQLRLQ